MKRIISIVIASLMAFNAFSQSSEDALVLASSKNETVKFEAFEHIGYGYSFTKSKDFDPSTGWEFFVNVLDLGIYPAENFGIDMGVDLLFNVFNQKNAVFFLDSDRNIRSVAAPVYFADIADIKKVRSDFSTFSFNVPLLFKAIFNDFSIGVGVEGSWNVTGGTDYNYRSNNHRTRVSENKAKVNPFSYGFLATIALNDGGIYFRYHPKSSHLLPQDGLDLSYMTLGIAFNF